MTCKLDGRTNFDNAHGKYMNVCFLVCGLIAGDYILQPKMNRVSQSSNCITYIFTNLSNYYSKGGG